MGTRTKYTAGTFSWVDLSSPDQAAAKKFYGSLFDWSYEDNPIGEGSVYSIAKIDGASVAALTPQPQQQREAGIPPAWNCYVTVESADQSATRAQQLGANVHAGPFDVFTAGRMAVVQDPQGAFVMLWEPRENIGAGVVNAPGALSWNDLITPDPEAAQRFYGELFGWTFSKFGEGMDYWVISNQGRGNGGIMAPREAGQPPAWLAYFGCEDVEDALGQVSAAGGSTIAPSMDISESAKVAVAADAQGAVFALYAGQFED